MAIDLPTAALAFIAALESVTGVPIAILERREDPAQFWARTAAILCEKTKENWCEEDVRFMTSNTEIMGMSRIIEYDFDGKGVRRVCALLPPIPNIHPEFIADAYGSPLATIYDYPSPTEVASWLMLYHAAHCLDTALNDQEESRAVAFATLGLSLMGGDYDFLPGRVRSSARQIAVMTGKASAYWAAGTGERILMDLWKAEAADRLRREHACYAIVTQNTSIDIERITRASSIPSGQDCAPVADDSSGPIGQNGRNNMRATPQGTVTDANLWLWLAGPQQAEEHSWPALGIPPMPYHAFKPFPDFQTAASYVLETANNLAR